MSTARFVASFGLSSALTLAAVPARPTDKPRIQDECRWRLMTHSRHSMLAVLALSAASQACNRDVPATPNPRFQSILEAAVQPSDRRVPGALLCVAEPHGRTYVQSAGLGDVRSATKMRPYDKFRAGSIMKPFIAAVVLQLTEEGAFTLDDVMPDVLDPHIAGRFQNSDRITVRMLLNHTSGIPEMLSDPVLARIAAEPEKVWSEEEWLDLATAQSPYFQPGEGWQYSNTDYVLLGLVIERATRHPRRREVRRRIIEPLDLNDTLLPEPGDLSIPGTFAHGYLTIEGELLDITRVDPSMAGAAGGSALVTTTRDLARFMETLLSGQLFRKKGTLDEMLTYVAAPDESGLPHYYGLGLEKYVLADDLELVGHAGATAGYAATVMRLPALNTTVAAAINIEDTMSVYSNIVVPVIETLKTKSAP